VVHPQAGIEAAEAPKQKNVDWDDDEIFDELLAAVPNGKTATDVHTPFNHAADAASPAPALHILDDTASVAAAAAMPAAAVQPVPFPKSAAEPDFDDLGDLLVDEADAVEPAPRTAGSYAQSSAFVKADIQTNFNPPAAVPESYISEDEKALIAANKDAFRDVWQDTAGKPAEVDFDEEDDFDLDAPLTDAMGRPMSRAMQVAKKRLDLPPLPGLELLDKIDPNKKVNFTADAF